MSSRLETFTVEMESVVKSWTLITCTTSVFDQSFTVAVKDMVSAPNLWMTSLHKLEPEHEIK